MLEASCRSQRRTPTRLSAVLAGRPMPTRMARLRGMGHIIPSFSRMVCSICWSEDTANSTVSGVTVNFGTATDLVTAQLQPTPVPAALPLFAGGLGLMGFLARRKKRKALNLLAAA